MNLQPPNPVWHMLNHEYHERLNTHGMALDRRAVIEHHSTMIHTMKKFACTCQPVPADARRE
ncbi:MAG: hypothetical protein WBO73_07090 [Gammaproteobacteria bacterium]|jgi:hypothetical protein